MHELPFVTELVRIAEEEAARQGLEKVVRIDVVTGELSAIVDECVQMYFEMIAEGTRCEGAKLAFEHPPAELRCPRCGKRFPHTHGFQCPECGEDAVLVKGTGQECQIKAIAGVPVGGE